MLADRAAQLQPIRDESSCPAISQFPEADTPRGGSMQKALAPDSARGFRPPAAWGRPDADFRLRRGLPRRRPGVRRHGAHEGLEGLPVLGQATPGGGSNPTSRLALPEQF